MNKDFYDCKQILITGGTGSFGKAFLKKIINQYPHIKRLVVFSRDELKQWELKELYPEKDYPQLRFFIGDIRNKDRFRRALDGIDIVIHCAALKQVNTAEFNPIEYIDTNVLGSENIVQACIESGVSKVVALSTDKASSPINLYGATKLCADKLFIAANNIIGSKKIQFSIVRYGNVMGSRGSVMPFFMEKAKTGVIPITDPEMTRFNISLEEGTNMVIYALENSIGGEILVPKIPSYRIIDVAKAIAPDAKIKIIGPRPGEKIHEQMISLSDSLSTYDIGNYYVILPPNENYINKFLAKNKNSKLVPRNFSFNSKNNSFLNVQEIRELIRKHIDPEFVPL